MKRSISTIFTKLCGN